MATPRQRVSAYLLPGTLIKILTHEFRFLLLRGSKALFPL
jgi:hypothetical protein